MTKKEVKVNRTLAKKILELVDTGLCKGLGKAEPGNMCIEAAVCYAMGLPHDDKPPCVHPYVRQLKISINDCEWSSNAARAKGMRRLAIAQLGTADTLNGEEFNKRIVHLVLTASLPRALRHAASVHPYKAHAEKLEFHAKQCEGLKFGDSKAANAAANAAKAADAAHAAARDKELSIFAEEVVQVLIKMKAPGCEWLDLTEAA